MAKSMRSKRNKRLRAIRREIVEPFYEKKDEAKLAAQEAALAAPKLPVTTTISTAENNMDVEMTDGNQTKVSLKPVGGIGKKSLRKLKLGKTKRRGKGWKKQNF